ncbi:hypothetical protein TCE0_013f01122 [Talaromyces pinophilus]|jgi:hypothetical protein|uniref:Subtilisin-like serine protease n=1 Tax=Talaromyces pinophilus TaxID=128442 RepID=A0A698XLI3_TALPI|nr:hypothetical protein TCE0_013f01122 [Talaromyces pinophilus]
MSETPFEESLQLCSSLVSSEAHGISRAPGKHSSSTLPGQAWVFLKDPNIDQYLSKQLLTPDLNELSPYLWLVANQDSSHVSSLTHQIVRRRSIVITENPEPHLVWLADRVFIKPLPKYPLSFAFWKHYLDPTSISSPFPLASRKSIADTAKGFLSSYAYLIRSKSDFRLAHSESNSSKRLIPGKFTFNEFVSFISGFERLKGKAVTPRYAFGELRLSRLNLWARIVLRKLHFQKTFGQYGPYFVQFYAPFAIVFAFYGVALNAMQVVLSAGSPSVAQLPWQSFVVMSRGFSIFALSSIGLASLSLLCWFIGLWLRELVFAMRDLFTKDRRRRAKAPVSPPMNLGVRALPDSSSDLLNRCCMTIPEYNCIT